MPRPSSARTAEIDTIIGRNLRQRRLAAGLTQEELGEKIDVSYQQVQKYESGVNRVSASRLWLIAEALDLSLLVFFARELDERAPYSSGSLS